MVCSVFLGGFFVLFFNFLLFFIVWIVIFELTQIGGKSLKWRSWRYYDAHVCHQKLQQLWSSCTEVTWRFAHGRPVKSHYPSRDGGSVIRLRDRRPRPTACAATYQPLGAANPSWRLLHTASVVWLHENQGRAGRRPIERHVSFRCVVCPKKRAFTIHVISHCSPLKPEMENHRELPGQLDFDSALYSSNVEHFWCGILQLHVLITSLTINPCCTHRVRRFHSFLPVPKWCFFIFPGAVVPAEVPGRCSCFSWVVGGMFLGGKNLVGRVAEAVSNNENCPNGEKKNKFVCLGPH